MKWNEGMEWKERKGKLDNNWEIYIYIFRGNGKEGMRKRKKIIWIIYETKG